MKTYNTNPYYDDFDDKKGFHQILFKPGDAVQARELTQLQTIIRSQIEKFGNHIFKHGSLVIPGNSFSELNVPYIKIQNTVADASYLIGKKLKQGSISALVKAIEPATTTNNYITLYLSYISGSGTTDSNEFSAGVISVDATYSSLPNNSPIAIDTVLTNFTGTGTLAYVNDGVYYVNGAFVKVNKQTIVISKDNDVLSCRVALQIIESIVTSEMDSSLLDPAQGSYNFAAPGADRIKIELKLVRLDLDSTVSNDYVELMRYRDGTLEEHTRYAKYSELEKSLARRTSDESGDYTVTGLTVNVQEHLRTGYNDGAYTLGAGGDADKIVVNVSSGKAYIQGYEVDKVGPTKLITDKGSDASHIMSDGKMIMPTGAPSYIYVTIDGSFFPNLQDFSDNINLYDGSGTYVGSLTSTGFEEETEGVYRLYFTGLKLNTGNIITSVATIRHDIFVVGRVVTKLNVSNMTAVISAGTVLDIPAAVSSRGAITVFNSAATPNVVWVAKNSTLGLPVGGDYFSFGSNSGTVTSTATIVTNTATSIYRVPGKLASFESSTGSYDVSYNALYHGTSTTTTPMTIPTGTGVLEYDASQTPRAPINAASVLHPDGITISNSVEDAAYSVSVRKTNVRPKLKTKNTATQVFNSFSLTSPAATKIVLNNVDGIQLVSVTYNQSGSTIDVTPNFSFSGGQGDEYYDYAYVSYMGGLTSAIVDLSITYEYFGHIDGFSDYFCVDSYPQEFIDKSVSYVATTGEFYDLLNCLDFRKSIANQSVMTTTARFTQLNPDSFITASFNYFVPRIDNVYMTKDGGVVLQRGTPANKPKAPALPNDVLSIASLFVPGNSKFATDVKVKRTKNRRYTMSDIRKLETRVNNIEKFSTLNALENSLVNFDIVDSSTGLNRFKTGYLVDNFDNVDGVCDYFSRLNRCNLAGKQLSCAIEAHESPVAVIDIASSNFQNTGGLITAKYTERALIDQNTSTRVTNLNPFMVFNWEGSMTIQPSVDSWVETEDLPTIFNSREEVITVSVPVFVEAAVWAIGAVTTEFASPFVIGPASFGPPVTPATVVVQQSLPQETPVNTFESVVAITPLIQEILPPAATPTTISDGEGGEWSTDMWTTNNRGQIIPIPDTSVFVDVGLD